MTILAEACSVVTRVGVVLCLDFVVVDPRTSRMYDSFRVFGCMILDKLILVPELFIYVHYVDVLVQKQC